MMNEKISALIDGELDELDERRVLQSLKTDAGLRCTWERYHLIRAALTRQLDVLAPPDMPERVWARLGDDIKAKPAALRFWPLAGGFAVAASLAVVAVFGLQTLRGPSPALMTVASTPPPATVASSAPATSEGAAPVVAVSASANAPVPAADAKAEEQLSLYLVGHNEFMPTGGMGNMLPYVRMVADSPANGQSR